MSKTKSKSETAGERLLRECDEDYESTPPDRAVLGLAAPMADLFERLVAEIVVQPLMTEGAAGQPVANPLHADLVRVAGQFAALLDRLQFPDRPASTMTTSERASIAARARWARRSA